MASELPKRLLRPGREPRVKQINNKCTMATLTKLATHLPNELKEIKRDPVFGPILKIPDNGLLYSARSIHSFLCRQLATDKKRERWFVFARRPHGRTNQVWGVDVDVVYIPLFVNQNHWIAMRVSFLERKIEVFDCGGGKNRRHTEKFAFLIPGIVEAVQRTGDKNQLSIQHYSIVDVPVRRRLNKNNSDCGVYALKFIECSVLGLDMGDIDDMTIGGARMRLSYDLWIAAQDPELIERMSKYESPEFEHGHVVELD